ncbi:hypothetical protein [Candidatus Lokiarchaeum ossiferum]|uniref:hypothetical protein n=1 Tax=Candidatus Lokiarchaeum ossiferum TaxID=2951803 RepID=UPI00352D65FB
MKKLRRTTQILAATLLILSFGSVLENATAYGLIIQEINEEHWGGCNTDDHMLGWFSHSDTKVYGYSFFVAHYQLFGTPVNWGLFLLDYSLPWYAGSIDFTAQDLEYFKVTISGYGFSTIVMHLVENGVYYSNRVPSGFQSSGLREGKDIWVGGDISIPGSMYGSATIKLEIKGTARISYKLFGASLYYKTKSFDLTYTETMTAHNQF